MIKLVERPEHRSSGSKYMTRDIHGLIQSSENMWVFSLHRAVTPYKNSKEIPLTTRE
jgi:hypothetical protein